MVSTADAKAGWSSWCRRGDHGTCDWVGARCACECHGAPAEQQRAWYAANKDRAAERPRAWYAANKDRHHACPVPDFRSSSGTL